MEIELNKTYLTRDGRKARVICTDMVKGDFTCVVLVVRDDGVEHTATVTKEGKYGITYDSDLDLVEEYSTWNDVPVDTKVVVWDCANDKHNRHFSHYKNGKIFVFADGTTSWTNPTGTAWWEYGEVYEEPTKEV